MKATILTLLALFAMELSSAAQGKLTVTVKNIRKGGGSIRVGLFANEKEFLKKAIHGNIAKAEGDVVTIIFDNVPAGDYGLSVIHDENDNGELDSNAIGMPKEGFAFGNNSMGMFGPPDFDDAKVTVVDKKDVSQTIQLKYL